MPSFPVSTLSDAGSPFDGTYFGDPGLDQWKVLQRGRLFCSINSRGWFKIHFMPLSFSSLTVLNFEVPGGQFGRDDSGHPFSRNPRKLDNPLIRNYFGHDRGKVDQSKNMGVLENPLAGNHSSCFRTDLAKSQILCS